MWWEWAIVMFAVGAALLWALRRVLRRWRGHTELLCSTCPVAHCGTRPGQAMTSMDDAQSRPL